MRDPHPLYELTERVVAAVRGELLSLAKAGALVAVALAVGVKVVLAWMEGELSGMQAAVLLATTLAVEGTAIYRLDLLQGASYALLLALPVALWAGTRMMARSEAATARQVEIRSNIARYRAVLRRDPSNAAAHSFLGDALIQLGDPSRAAAEYRVALALDPHSYPTRYKLERARRLMRAGSL